MTTQVTGQERISRWWPIGVTAVLLSGFVVLIALSVHVYRVAPPIPRQVDDPSGLVLFTENDIKAGQAVFLKYGLMENGTLWGHGAYLGPDFSAEYLHEVTLDTADAISRERFRQSPDRLSDSERAALRGLVHEELAQNRYDASSGTLRLTAPEADSFRRQVGKWSEYFADPKANRGLRPKLIRDSQELRQLTAFFAWAAWASVAHVPGKAYSYTNNFPYDPALGNGPSSDAIVWSALSLMALLGGTAGILLAFGRFRFLGWKSPGEHIHPQMLPGGTSDSQRAVIKFYVVVAFLFLAQVIFGGAVAHFRADPKSFFGLDIASIFPSNVTRTWHLQLAIFWIATAYVGGGLFLASALGKREPAGHVFGINLLFWALTLVVFGSLIGEFLGVFGILPKTWFWFGHQGWEYLDLGRAWQVLLAAGFVIWVILLIRAVGETRKDPQEREVSRLFLLSASAIPLFYVPAFFFGSGSHFSVVDTWRFWIIHLWVEGFFELFVTVMVAVTFLKFGMVSRQTATRVIYLDALLFLGSGIIGTGHHWYWTGQTSASMALSATFSAMEVVPLILLTLDASDFIRLSRSTCDICGKRIAFPHKWTFYFLIAVGVWNFVGAGVFGFLINLPVVSYYEVGTVLTANHGHAALMGVFGMLAVALVVFGLRQVLTDQEWAKPEKYVRVSFWGLNVGLAAMVLTNLFPLGVLQLRDVVQNGYWHARSPAFMDSPVAHALEWARMPGDMIFIVFGVLPLLLATLMTYWKVRKARAEKSAVHWAGTSAM
jgi:nitric oxide reductase subunit B